MIGKSPAAVRGKYGSRARRKPRASEPTPGTIKSTAVRAKQSSANKMATTRGPSHIARTEAQKSLFLASLATGISVTASAKAAGTTRSTAYYWRDHDETFAVAMASAIEEGTDALEDHCFARATDAEKPSDLLTIFLLKARRPQKFRDNIKIEHDVTLKPAPEFMDRFQRWADELRRADRDRVEALRAADAHNNGPMIEVAANVQLVEGPRAPPRRAGRLGDEIPEAELIRQHAEELERNDPSFKYSRGD